MAPVKKTSTKKAAAVVEEVKTAAEETVKKAPAKKTAAKKTTAKAAEAAAEVKETAKKAPAKKATKKAAAPKVTINVEYHGAQHVITDVADKALKAYAADHKGVAVETLEVYCKPEDGVAYYVVNGEASESFKVEI